MRPDGLILPHGWQDTRLLEIKKLLPAFREKFFVEPVSPSGWGIQRSFDINSDKINWFYPKRLITDPDLIDHFRGRPKRVSSREYHGALAFRGSFANEQCRWFCLDVDDEEWVGTVAGTFLPTLSEYGIKYIYEYGGYDYERAHIWFMVDCDLDLLRKFIDQITLDSGLKSLIDDWCRIPGNSRAQLPVEFYPTQKPNNFIRMMGGPHMKAGTVYPCIYQDYFYETTTDIMECVIDAQIHTRFMINNKLRSIPKFTPNTYPKDTPESTPKDTPKIVPRTDERSSYKKRSRFSYKSRDLPVSARGLTSFGKVIAHNCQAFNTIVNKIRKERLLEQGGSHRLLMYLAGIFKYSGVAQRHELKEVLGEYEDVDDWSQDEFNDFISKYRDYDIDKHNVDWLWNRNTDFMPNCQTWEADFNLCEGCPFRKREDFYNPKQFWYGDQIEWRELKDIPIMPVDEIRKWVFSKTKKEVVLALNNQERLDLACVPVTGSGKSTFADELAAQLIQMGYRVLISTPSGEVAMEHRQRLIGLGVDPLLMLMSWSNTFKYLETIKCPYSYDIEKEVKAGVRASSIKKDYCKGCEYKDECLFATQYVTLEKYAKDEDHIDDPLCTIMQHAHFNIPQVMRKIKQAKFDVLIIDEQFSDSIKKYFKVTNEEIRIIKKLSRTYPWAKDMLDWLDGYPVIDPLNFRVPSEDLVEAYDVFKKAKVQNRLTDIISFISIGNLYNTFTGTFRAARMPLFPVRICLDATAHLPTVKAIFGNRKLKTIGRNMLIDPIAQHPNNELIQIVDGTSSRFSHEEEGKLEMQLDWWAMKLRTKWSWMKKTLVTVFHDEIKPVEAYFRTNHPDVADKIIVNHMSVGVNTWADTDAQLLIAAVYFNTKQIRHMVWEHRYMAQEQLEEGERIPNLFPINASEDDQMKDFKMPVRLVLRHEGPDGNVVGKKIQLDNFTYRLPLWEDHQIPVEMAQSKTIQAIRTRLMTGKPTKIVVWNNRRMYGFCFTGWKTEEECFSELRDYEDGVIPESELGPEILSVSDSCMSQEAEDFSHLSNPRKRCPSLLD